MSNMRTNLTQLEKDGYKQLIQASLPNPEILNKIKANPAIDIQTIPDLALRELVTNMRTAAISLDPKNADRIFIENLNDMISGLEILGACIEEKKIVPVQSVENVEPVKLQGQISQRLFLKEGKIYQVPYRELIKESKKDITPSLSTNFQGIYAIMAVRNPDGMLVLEHRVKSCSSSQTMSGHPALIDNQYNAVVSAGEEFICNGEHKLTANKTGNCNEQVSKLKMSLNEERALTNLCLRGLAREFYRIELIPGTKDINEDLYTQKRDSAGVDSVTPPLASPLPATPAMTTRTLTTNPTSSLRTYSLLAANVTPIDIVAEPSLNMTALSIVISPHSDKSEIPVVDCNELQNMKTNLPTP